MLENFLQTPMILQLYRCSLNGHLDMIDIPTLVQYIKTKIKFAPFERNSTSFVYMCSF